MLPYLAALAWAGEIPPAPTPAGRTTTAWDTAQQYLQTLFHSSSLHGWKAKTPTGSDGVPWVGPGTSLPTRKTASSPGPEAPIAWHTGSVSHMTLLVKNISKPVFFCSIPLNIMFIFNSIMKSIFIDNVKEMFTSPFNAVTQFCTCWNVQHLVRWRRCSIQQRLMLSACWILMATSPCQILSLVTALWLWWLSIIIYIFHVLRYNDIRYNQSKLLECRYTRVHTIWNFATSSFLCSIGTWRQTKETVCAYSIHMSKHAKYKKNVPTTLSHIRQKIKPHIRLQLCSSLSIFQTASYYLKLQ